MSLDIADWKCPVCLEEPMCKPTIPPCGHSLCFWCVHRAMDSFGASACPTCRQSFEHLPDVCVLLHQYLARAFPKQYACRLRETFEEEETKECFSPSPALGMNLQIRTWLTENYAVEKINMNEIDVDTRAVDVMPSFSLFHALERMPPVTASNDPSLKQLFLCGFRDKGTKQEEEEEQQQQQEQEQSHQLCLPVVLTCGHAICAGCAATRLDFGLTSNGVDNRTRRRCPTCDARVVGNAPPTVCLPLHALTSTFLDEGDDTEPRFEDEPVTSSASATDDGAQTQPPQPNGSLAETFLQVTGNADPDTFSHYGCGCDGCGVYPIRGRRFRCLDCPEAMGFDLCSTCNDTATDEVDEANEPKTILGRFNQNHQPTHSMQEVTPTPTMMHVLTQMHPELTPSMIVDFANQHGVGAENRDPPVHENEGTGDDPG